MSDLAAGNAPLVELIDVARHFDVSPPWLNRVLERKPRALLKAVDGVSFTIARGETLGLVGESGCGKSTVARLIVGLYRPTRGEIRYAGSRVDANAAWTAKHAVRMSEFLADQGVEMLEQPVPANDIEGLRFVRKRSKLPIFADESCLVATDIAKLAGAVDGINIKLAKCGSLREALRMVHTARALDMQVMAGCMIESSLGISAIAQISPLLDFADFDGAALLSSDPFRGTSIAGGAIRLSDGPGLGVTPAPSIDLSAAFSSA